MFSCCRKGFTYMHLRSSRKSYECIVRHDVLLIAVARHLSKLYPSTSSFFVGLRIDIDSLDISLKIGQWNCRHPWSFWPHSRTAGTYCEGMVGMTFGCSVPAVILVMHHINLQAWSVSQHGVSPWHSTEMTYPTQCRSPQ
ncbi:hypothetical protein P170DRAFT_253690 [Aspergillus steynii IBT 23096]|uniref:Uncharacterized protein n=1 Tax=Aspergillus steynii IBT 23096 TaxID=1392250 RepID=A0A2I2FYY1_9EURO|nr:uncharacterized protein P170DRAFT_253690 [Aspergillus steynii IBT 23096]PLB45853.1 hypothetical protein P170DRAFT_253690 [Aspergillus steynii IBT 23096]